MGHLIRRRAIMSRATTPAMHASPTIMASGRTMALARTMALGCTMGRRLTRGVSRATLLTRWTMRRGRRRLCRTTAAATSTRPMVASRTATKATLEATLVGGSLGEPLTTLTHALACGERENVIFTFSELTGGTFGQRARGHSRDDAQRCRSEVLSFGANTIFWQNEPTNRNSVTRSTVWSGN